MIELVFAAALAAAGQKATAVEPLAPRHWNAPSWSRMPMPHIRSTDRGTTQAEMTCTVGERGSPQDCRVLRVAPEGTDFGRRALSSLRRARVKEGQMRPGDTFTFTLWVCPSADRAEVCRRIPWETE